MSPKMRSNLICVLRRVITIELRTIEPLRTSRCDMQRGFIALHGRLSVKAFTALHVVSRRPLWRIVVLLLLPY